MKYEDRVPSTIPTTAELEAAPMIDRWHVIAAEPWKQGHIWGYFRGHPEIADGTYAHSSPVIYLEDKERPTWAVCRKRIYVLGKPMGAAERAIRELAGAFPVSAEPPDLDAPENRWIARFAGAPSDLGEADWLLINLDRGGFIAPEEFERLYRALLDEREAL